MDKQMTISLISDELREAQTPKRELLERMDAIIPWERWVGMECPIPRCAGTSPLRWGSKEKQLRGSG